MNSGRKRHLRLVLNGRAAALPALREAVRELRGQGHRVEVRVTWEGGDAERYAAEAVADRVEVVVAAGGDGTVNEVVNGLLRADAGPETALAVLPFGTANDFAHCCRIPVGDLPAALRLILQRPAVPIDVGQVNDRFFLNVASGGFGAEVTRSTPPDMKRLLGGAAYSVMGLVTAAKMTPYRARIRLEDREHVGNVLLLAVGNGRQAGGGFPVTPHALLNDGLLDLMVVHDVEVAEFGSMLSELLDMRATDNKYVHYRQLDSFELETEKPLQLNLDGEPFRGTSFSFRTLPGRLMCVLPESAPLAPAEAINEAESRGASDKDYRMVQIGTLDNPAIAELVRIELEEAGIRCHLEGMHQAGLAGVLPIRLFVPASSEKQAREIVARHARNA